MKKTILIFFILICILGICSCDNTDSGNNNNDDTNNKQDSSLDGIDLSKYEMPQTGFMYDGHTLSKFEEVMKFVILDGTFIYEKYLNSIGYRYILEESNDEMLYAYYCVNELRLIHIKVYGKVVNMSYVKLTDTSDSMTVCYKIQYNSGWRQDFYAIMNCERSLFDNEYVGEYELYRGYCNATESEITSLIVSQNFDLLQKFNSVITEKINISLSEFGYKCE